MNVKIKFGHSGGDEERVIKVDACFEDLFLEYGEMDVNMPYKNRLYQDQYITKDEYTEITGRYFDLQRRVIDILPGDWRIRHYLHVEVV